MMAVREVLVRCFVGSVLVSRVRPLCFPAQCLNCENKTNVPALNGSSEVCNICTNNTCLSAHIPRNSTQVPEIPPNCKKDFKAHLNSSSGYYLDEGHDLILHCLHNLPLLNLFEWQQDRRRIYSSNDSTLRRKAFSAAKGDYRCIVHSPCGRFTSGEKRVDVNDSVVLLLVLCGFCSVVLVLGMGAAMKYKQKTEQAAQKRRQEERAKALQMTSSISLSDN